MKPTSERSDRLRRAISIALFAASLSLFFLGAVSFVSLNRDSQKLESLSLEFAGDLDEPSDRMRAIAEQFDLIRPLRDPETYFLHPIFRSLRRTAVQTLERGGQCADRSRALVVMLHQLHIPAERLALFDGAGKTYHAVVRVETERGDYIIDALYGIIYDHPDGAPMTVEFIAENLPQVMQDELEQGNRLVGGYPVYRGDYQRLGTPWTGNPMLRPAHFMMSIFMTEDEIREVPRPYLMEEPAALVGWAAMIAAVFLVGAGLVLRPRSRN